MTNLLNQLGIVNEKLNEIYKPDFFRTGIPEDRLRLEELLKKNGSVVIHDTIREQLKELIKSSQPSVKIAPDAYPELIHAHLNGCPAQDYGVWVYYPWSRHLVHLLDETEFVALRTNRNLYKITPEERDTLAAKKVGIIGLSVGQTIAITMAMERTCGELRLADFDTLDLSNLNRLRSGIQNIGLKKVVIAAREIAEIDPFINVRIFEDGVTEQNIDSFFSDHGQLDLLVEVCDGLDVKILSRYKARSLQIPVVMDTNDRGMLDVERFDLEPDRPLLHGLAGDLDPQKLKGLTNEEKIPYIMQMVGAETLSTRLKASMMEVEQSISTWPQLASSVMLGGAITTDAARRILLDQYHESGRYYIDIEDFVKDEATPQEQTPRLTNPYQPLSVAWMEEVALANAQPVSYTPDAGVLDQIMAAALAAPSAGNNQPWKWLYRNGQLFLFHDKVRSWSWGDFAEMGAHMSLGTALENVHLQAIALHLQSHISLFPAANNPYLVAAITFAPATEAASPVALQLAQGIFTRHTNRKLDKKVPLPESFYTSLAQHTLCDNLQVYHTDKESDLLELGEIIAICDKIRLLTPQGHEEFFHEVRWTDAEARQSGDGIDIAAVDLTRGEVSGFKMANNWDAIALLAEWDKGNIFKKSSLKALQSASGMVLCTIKDFNPTNLVNAGRTIQQLWIAMNQLGVSVHPMLSPAFFFNRMRHGRAEETDAATLALLQSLRERFLKIFPLTAQESEIFLFKLAVINKPIVKSYRLPQQETFIRIDAED